MARKSAESEKGAQKNRVRERPPEGHIGNLVEKVFEDQIKRGLMLGKNIHLLEEEDNDVDESQTAQA
jgi:hypothetical protein